MKSVGIFGGSFDPVHIGHLITTQYVYEQRNLEKIIFIPNHISPLKQSIVPTHDEHRLKMLQLAVEPFPHFDVSDFEIKRKDVSYTLDTLIKFKKEYDNLELIIGYDNLCIFDKWRMPEKIIGLAKLVVMKRSTDIEEKPNRYLESAIFINTPTIEISSTVIRRKIKNNQPIDYLVPQKVKEYIAQNRLYI